MSSVALLVWPMEGGGANNTGHSVYIITHEIQKIFYDWKKSRFPLKIMKKILPIFQLFFQKYFFLLLLLITELFQIKPLEIPYRIGMVTFLQLPQIYAQKLILLCFVSSKLFSDWKSVEISQTTHRFLEIVSQWIFFSKNFKIIVESLLTARSIRNFILKTFKRDIFR